MEKLTRRQLAGLLGAPALARPQEKAGPAEDEQQLLAAARDRMRRNAEALAKVRVPVETEPAFQFRAS